MNLKEIIKNKDINEYKLWVAEDWGTLKDFQKDKYIIEFELICKEYEGVFKTPTEKLEYSLKLLMNYAVKYQCNFIECFNTAKLVKTSR